MTPNTDHIIAYCPGSYDPVTNGHVDIIGRAAGLFAEVVIGVATEAEKEHLFALAERIAMVQEACAELTNVRVEGFSGLVVEAAVRAGARVLVKGLRQAFDLAHEAPMAHMNESLRPELETVFLLSNPANAHVSSSLIKWVCGMGGDVSAQVPPQVVERLRLKLGEQQAL